jgi:hypothetical protein
MPDYDASKDRELAVVWQKVDDGKGQRVRLVSYNGGETKVAYEEVWTAKAGGQRSRAMKRIPLSLWRDTGKAVLAAFERLKEDKS